MVACPADGLLGRCSPGGASPAPTIGNGGLLFARGVSWARFGFGGLAQGFDFAGFKRAVAVAGDAFDAEGAERNADPFFNGVAGFEHDVAQGFFLCVTHANFVPIVGGVTTSRIGLAQGLETDAGFFAEMREFVAREHAFDLDVVTLFEMLPILEQRSGEVAVVREKNEAAGGVFEISHWVDACWKTAERVDERFAAFGIGHGSDDVDWFVKRQVDVRFSGGDEFSGGFDFVGSEVGFRAKFGDDFAVHADLAAEDELFGVPARGDAGSGDEFLKAFAGHGLENRKSKFETRVEQRRFVTSHRTRRRLLASERSKYCTTRRLRHPAIFPVRSATRFRT